MVSYFILTNFEHYYVDFYALNAGIIKSLSISSVES